MWYFPETNLPDLWGCGGFAPTLRTIMINRLPNLTDEELDILIDIFISIK